MSRRYARTVDADASPGEVFPRLDDQTRLAGHMEKPSAMMGRGRMSYTFDEARGQAVGSHIRMSGSAFGLSLMVDEVVTEREPPRRKAWRTTGTTRLVILESHAMGFEIEPADHRSRLTVWMDYERPRGAGAILGLLLAPLYARWCVGRMVEDAVRHWRHGAAGLLLRGPDPDAVRLCPWARIVLDRLCGSVAGDARRRRSASADDHLGDLKVAL